jgi:uncharacterized damage-inducible protein DinB
MTHAAVLEICDRYLAQYLDRIRESVALLSEEQVWWRANRRSNSVGNLILHLCGNLSQWVLDGLGGESFERRRSLEFSADGGVGKAELLERLTNVIGRCREVVTALDQAALDTSRQIQGVDTTGLGTLLHAVEHMSYHTGQVVFVAKQLAPGSVEIEFYPERRNE